MQLVVNGREHTVHADPAMPILWALRDTLGMTAIVLLWSTFSYARYAEPQHGKEMLQKLCARCHSVGRTSASPNRLAPPFRTFSETKLYDSDFMQRLQDGYSSIHPFMPTFRFNRDDALEVLNYMESIQETPKPKYPPARGTEPLKVSVTWGTATACSRLKIFVRHRKLLQRWNVRLRNVESLSALKFLDRRPCHLSTVAVHIALRKVQR